MFGRMNKTYWLLEVSCKKNLDNAKNVLFLAILQ